MIFNKALLTGLVGVSLCMANISGIVTDSAGVGIAGAIVTLLGGRQSDTTESNGRFILNTGTTGISGQINQALPNKLSASMHNGLLCLGVVEKSAVEISTFDLNGKALSKVCRSFDAGSHSVGLPYRGAGVYLYKVKSCNSEVVLKSNSVDGVSFGSSVTTQGSSSKFLAKQTMAVAVIITTKNGYLNSRVDISNPDTSEIVIKMIFQDTGSVADIDGNVYHTIKIGNQVWMTENLRVTKYNDESIIPLDTARATWVATTPKCCYYKNTTNADSIKKYGALYNWYTVNTGKLAPSGWHVPSNAEWDTLLHSLYPSCYYNSNAERDNFQSSVMPNNYCDFSAFSALPGGWREDKALFDYQGSVGQAPIGFWWSATERDATYAGHCFCMGGLIRNDIFKTYGLSVRLLKD